MRDAVEHESIGRLTEAYALIEAFGILLCLNIDARSMKVRYGGINSVKHNLPAIALASFGGNYSADRDLLHMSASGTNTSQGNHLSCDGEPEAERRDRYLFHSRNSMFNLLM